MQDLKLIEATRNDTGIISGLARLIWNQHYPAFISRQQIDYMLNLMYGKESLEDQILNKGHRFFLLNINKNNVGFVSMNREKDNNWFLNKFYINQQVAAKGIGGTAFEALKKQLRPEKITLTVNRQNFKSINFYFKMGFKIERVADFEIGNGFVMNDFVMVWEKS